MDVAAALSTVETIPRPSVFAIGHWVIPRSAVVFPASFGAALFFFLAGPYSNFGAPGYLDPWIYTGYFMHFSYLVQHYGINYYVSRLPWIVPGLLMFKVATPAVASVILNALIMACGATAVYFIVSWHYSALPAMLACIALVTNPYLVSAISWDYPDGPAIAYAFLALACFLRPGRGAVPYSLLGGVCLALSAYTNFAALPALAGILAIPLWRHRRSLREFGREALYVICGVLFVTLVLAAVARGMIGTYYFFLPQIEMIRYARTHPEYLANMWGTGYAWIPAAYRLFPALFLLFLGGVLFVRRRKCSRAYGEGYLCLAVTCALFCIFEFYFHNVGLRVAYCSTYMMAPLLAFGGLFIGELLSSRRKVPAFLMSVTTWIAVAAFGMALPFYYALTGPAGLSPGQAWTALLIIGVVAAICAAIARSHQLFLFALTCCLWFSGLFFGPAWDGSLGYIWLKGNAAVFQSVMDVARLVDSGVAPDRIVRFWYDLDEPARPVANLGRTKVAYFFDSAYSLYLWGYFDFTKQLPAGPPGEIRRLVNAHTTFVHLSVNADETPRRAKLLAGRGIVTGNERRWILPSVYGNVYVVLQDVLDISKMH